MSGKLVELDARLRRVLIAQAVIALVAGVVVSAWLDVRTGISAVCGVVVASSLSLLLARSVCKAGAVSAADPKRGMVVLYVGAVQRFVFMIAAFALGLAVFDLHPFAMAAGFVAAQLAQLANARALTGSNEDKGLK